MADGIKTLGTLLKMSTEVGSPQTWVTLGNFQSWTGPNATRKIIDTPNLSSDAVTKMAGLLDGGEFNFVLNYDPAQSTHQAVQTALDDGNAREFALFLTDSGAAEVHFSGIVKSSSLSGPFDDKVTLNIGIAITGRPWISY